MEMTAFSPHNNWAGEAFNERGRQARDYVESHLSSRNQKHPLLRNMVGDHP